MHISAPSGATGKLNDDRVMEVVIETIGVHLPDLEALSLTNNGLKTLRVLSKIVEKAPKIKVLYLDRNKLMQCKELDNVSKLNLNVLKLDGNPFLGNFKDGTDYSNQAWAIPSIFVQNDYLNQFFNKILFAF